MNIKVNDIEAFIKRLYFLAYQGAGRELGMGVFQARTNATEGEIYKCVCEKLDYPFTPEHEKQEFKHGRYYGDYVFGRMIKFGCEVKDGVIGFHDRPFDPEYQGFARKYPSLTSLLDAVAASLNVSYEIVSQTCEAN
jgi:hypothetical protein